MFDNLKGQIETDVAAYNALFSKQEECKATFVPTEEGFRVERRGKAVRVTRKTGTTIIDIEHTTAGERSTLEHLEVAADLNQQGHVYYKHKAEFLDVNKASGHILDRVLCS